MTDITSWTNKVEKTINAIRDLAEICQPGTLHLDRCLELDKFSMMLTPGADFVWIMRSNSTSLIPLNRGTHLATQMSFNEGLAFSVSPASGVVELIDLDLARSLVETKTAVLERAPKQAVIRTVNQIIYDFQKTNHTTPQVVSTKDWGMWRKVFVNLEEHKLVEMIDNGVSCIESM